GGLERMRIAGLTSEEKYAAKSAEMRAQLGPAPVQQPLAPSPAQPSQSAQSPAAPAPPAQWSPPPAQGTPPPAPPQGWTPAPAQTALPDVPPSYPQPAYPAWQPAQPVPAARKASKVTTVVASLVVTGLLGGGLAAYAALSRPRDSAAAGAGAAASAPKQPVPDAVAQFIPVAQKFVEDHRGLKFIHAVAVTMLDDSSFEQKLTGGPAPSKQASTG